MSYVALAPGSDLTTEIEIKRSRFIGRATRVGSEEQARQFLASVRAAHIQARHVCHAFVVDPDRRTQRFSDDGEPAGTAGAPILTAITARQTGESGAQLSDIVVAVVRYFGGIKLGAGGLVQAYSQTAAQTLDTGTYLRRRLMREITCSVNYDNVGRLETSLRAFGVVISEVEYGADAVVHTWVADEPEVIHTHLTRIAELTNGQVTPDLRGTAWVDS